MAAKSARLLRVLGNESLAGIPRKRNQEVYRLQGVNIKISISSDCRQMLRWVKIKEVGDTEFSAGRAGGSFPLPGRERTRAPG